MSTSDLSAEDLIRKWCNFGWQYRGLHKMDAKSRAKYIKQVEYELSLIVAKGFTDYFLVMSDVLRHLKDNQIPVGPGRGSSAASLVCYLLRITEIDPMKFPVMQFERFIDPNRFDLPDVDTDIDDDFRHHALLYFIEKYGADHVGNIGTFGGYKGKNSLDDIARVYDLPRFEIARIKDFVIERTAGDEDGGHDLLDTIAAFPQVKEVFDKYPVLYLATRLEGNLKGFGVHAAGIVVGSAPLTDSVASYARMDAKTKVMRKVLSVDMKDSEHLGLMKLDALGLRTMGMLRIALEITGMSLQQLYEIPLDDPETLKLFHDADVTGIFQFEGGAARTTTQQMKAKTFMDLAAINTLSRPGPLHSGGTGDYLAIRHGKMERSDPHPMYAKITADTEGQIIYQEQIVAIVRELGGFSWADATTVRKIVAKSKGAAAFKPLWEQFAAGCAANGIDREAAQNIWDRIVSAGAYAFNAAHSVAYSALGFWCAWLKVHHPIAFYTAQLRKIDMANPTGKQRQKALLRDMVDRGFTVETIELNKSGMTWEPTATGVRAGFTQIKGVGDSQATAILAQRELMAGFDGWEEVVTTKGIGPSKMKELMAFAAMDDPFEIGYLGKMTSEIKAGIRSGKYECPMPDTEAEHIPYEAVTSYHTVLVTVNKRIPKNFFENYRAKHGHALDPKTVRDPELADYMTLHCEDVSEAVTISVNRWLFPRVRERLEAMEIGRDFAVVSAKKMDSYGKILLATDMWFIDTEKGSLK